MRFSARPSIYVFGFGVTIDRERKRTHIVLPFLSVLIEGEREWPPGTQPNLVGMHLSANEFYVGMEGGACAAVAEGFGDDLDRVGAENYVVMDFEHPKHGPISVTVQRRRGKTPSDLVLELQRELAELKAAA